MSLGTGTVFQMQSDGSDSVCAGGFNPGNANFPTDGAVSSATGASPVFSAASYPFVAGDVGALLFIKSGANSIPAFYPIVSVAGGQATLDAAIGHACLYSLFNPSTVLGCGTSASLSSLTWGICYIKRATARISFTDMVIDGTTNTKFTSVANPVGKNFVGNLIQVTSGTGFTAQFIEVVSTTGTAATCDKSLGTLSSTGGVGYLGGALASQGLCSSLVVTSAANGRAWIKYGTYTITSATAQISGGCWRAPGGGNGNNHFILAGYDSVWGDRTGNKPTLILGAAVSSASMIIPSSDAYGYENMILDGNSQTSSSGITGTAGWTGYAADVDTQNFTAAAVSSAANTTVIGGIHTNIASMAVTNGHFMKVVASASPASVFFRVFSGVLTHSTISAGGASFATATNIAAAINCTFYNANNVNNNSSSGNQPSVYVNCLFHTITTGVNFGGGRDIFENCAFYNCPTKLSGSVYSSFGQINCTVDPCTNAAGGDFTPNNTANGGALLRAAGYMDTNNDVGSRQASVSSGGLQLNSGLQGGLQ